MRHFITMLAMATLIAAATANAQPTNDDFADRIRVIGLQLRLSGNNVGATAEPGEPLPFFPAGGRTVWWEWTAPVSSTVHLSTAGSGFDTQLAVFHGNRLDQLGAIQTDDDSAGNLASQLQFTAFEGVTYQIVVDGYLGASGPISLEIQQDTALKILSAPADRGALVGRDVEFRFGVTGPGTIRYQWSFQGVGLPGATNSSLVLTNVQFSHSGAYVVRARNEFGAQATATATLTVREGYDVAVFTNLAYIDPGPSPYGRAANLLRSIEELGYREVPYGDLSELPARVVVMPQIDYKTLTGAELAVPAALVRDGGTLIIPGGYQPWNLLPALNEAFGWNLQINYMYTPAQRAPSAIGTPFETVPQILSANYQSGLIISNSLPAGSTVLHQNEYGAAAAVMPAGLGRVVWLGWNWYDALPVGYQNGGWIAALGAAIELGRTAPLPDRPPVIASTSGDRTVAAGRPVTFRTIALGSEPLSYQWFHETNALAGATNATFSIAAATSEQDGAYRVIVSNSFGQAESNPIQLTVYEPGPLEFRILELGTDATLVEHEHLTGDDRGGIALTESQVFVTGDWNTARFRSEDLANGTALGVSHDGLVTDLRMRTTYIFQLGNTTTLTLLDPETGAVTGETVQLSQSIPTGGYGGGVFSGFGRAVIRSGQTGHAYEILFTDGTVIDHGPQPLEDFQSSENWAIWGVLEHFDGQLHLTYRSGYSSAIVRRTLGSSVSTVVQNFSNLGDIASFVVDPYRGRWYFHQDGNSQFGWLNEAVGFASAEVAFVGVTAQSPVLFSHPVSQTAISGQTAQFSAAALGTAPLHYQWSRDDLPIANATNRVLTLPAVTLADAGSYRVAVTNAFGGTNSLPATLSVVDAATLHFQVHSLGTNAVTVEHSHLTGDDRGGIAVSENHVFVTGDASTARHRSTDLGGGAALGLVHDGLISDLRSRTAYILGTSNVIWYPSFGPANSLIRLDSATGLPSSEIISLSRPLPLAWGSKMFSGFGRFVVVSALDGRGYDVLLPSGMVMELGELSLADALPSESWASWGVAEYHDNTLHLLYRHANYPWIVRRRLGEFNSTVFAEFANLSDLASFVVDPYRGRWYFTHQYTSQFASGTQNLGFAPAVTSHYAATNQPPYILRQPAPQVTDLDGAAFFSVNALGTPPLYYRWWHNNESLAHATDAQLALPNVTLGQAGQYRVVISNAFGAVTSAPAVLQISGPQSSHFRIVSLGTNAVTVEHEPVTGDDRGGIALSSVSVLVTGDQATGRFAREDLSAGSAVGRVYDGLCSDLRSRRAYTLGFNSSPLVSGQLTANSLIAIDGYSGQLTSEIIPLSQPIPLSPQSGIFSGYGRILVRSSATGRAYDITLPSGQVTDLGATPVEDANIFTENWAFWGVVEYFNNALHLVYRNQANQIVRRAVGMPGSSVLASFVNLADLTSFTVDVELGRWYFHHEGASDLGSGQEVLGYANAVFETLVDPESAPVITRQPVSLRTFEGRTAHLWIDLAGGEPTSYQWYRNGQPVTSPVGSHLGLTNITAGDSGFYWIAVSNSLGVAVSEPAFVLVEEGVVPTSVNAAYLRSQTEMAWGDSDNVNAMNRVFGSNQWAGFHFETAAIPDVFSATNQLIVIDGSANTADAFETFLAQHRNAIETWVTNGGSLYLNSAPSTGDGMLLWFAGLQLNFPDYQSTVSLEGTNPLLTSGPFLPVGTNWSGVYAANATVSGPQLTPLLRGGTSGGIVVGEKQFGGGRVLLNTLTPPSFHQPDIEAQNLRANLLAYAASVPAPTATSFIHHFHLPSPGGGELLLASAHQPGEWVWLQGSTNLVAWETISTNLVPSSGVLIIPVPLDRDIDAGFFRIWTPQ